MLQCLVRFIIVLNSKFMYKKFVTIKEAAKILSVSPLTLRNWDSNGKFVAHRHPINNYRVYNIQDVENLLLEIERSKGFKPTRDKIKKLVVRHLGDE